MQFTNAQGHSLSLTIQGYEFPSHTPTHASGHTEEDYDANWLLIRLFIDSPALQWQVVDPALLTWEVSELIEWLEQIAQGQAVGSRFEALEPNLRIRLLAHEAQQATLKFELRAEFRPPGTPSDQPFVFESTLDLAALAQQAAHFAQEFRNFPPR